jgi:hypothetical protein
MLFSSENPVERRAEGDRRAGVEPDAARAVDGSC